MNNPETPEGLRLLYDLLVKASEFPGETPHNPRNLYSWGEKLKALHQIMSAYHDAEYLQEYRLAQKNILPGKLKVPPLILQGLLEVPFCRDAQALHGTFHVSGYGGHSHPLREFSLQQFSGLRLSVPYTLLPRH